MADYRQDYISYRLVKSNEAFEDAEFLAQNESWNSCINRLYYAAYYAVSALLLQYDINAQTHSGCKAQFGLHFVKPGLVTIEQGRLYADLMDWRQKGDYGDMFDFDKETVAPIFKPLKEFLDVVRKLIERKQPD